MYKTRFRICKSDILVSCTCEKAPGRIVVSPVFARDREVMWGRGGKLEGEREGREVEER